MAKRCNWRAKHKNKMDWNFIIFSIVKIAIVIGAVQTFAAYAVLAERKISAWIQDRVGPNRVAPPFMKYVPILGPVLTRMGIFQPLADGSELFRSAFMESCSRATRRIQNIHFSAAFVPARK